jgi:hypothetical protein
MISSLLLHMKESKYVPTGGITNGMTSVLILFLPAGRHCCQVANPLGGLIHVDSESTNVCPSYVTLAMMILVVRERRFCGSSFCIFHCCPDLSNHLLFYFVSSYSFLTHVLFDSWTKPIVHGQPSAPGTNRPKQLGASM